MEGVVNPHEEQQALFHATYPSTYYVQSPISTTLSHSDSVRNAGNSEETDATFTIAITNRTENTNLSRYSSRGSNHLFLHDHNQTVTDHQTKNDETDLIVFGSSCADNGDDGDHPHDHDDKKGEYSYYYGYDDGTKEGVMWKRYLSYRNSDSCAWVCFQLCWRALVSLSFALLVFYIATKPPSPIISIKMARIQQFKLGEGVDQTGVSTKILTCNLSIHLILDNKSKLFGLHVLPPIMQISFIHLPFAVSHGPTLYAESGSTIFELNVGSRNRPMYGAGRSMEDELESGKGLELIVGVSLRSNFEVVWNLIKPHFYHHFQCLVVLDKAYDKIHHTQAFNSTCYLTSYST